jgi:hypothetical protein
MKTNASIETITKAVETVSAKLYDGNVIFRKEPQHITKNVVRFTLKTKDAEKPGSIETSNGQKHPKANWQVHLDVAKAIFKIENKANIYIDTIAGRMYNDDIPNGKKQLAESEDIKAKFVESLKFVFDHKELLSSVSL